MPTLPGLTLTLRQGPIGYQGPAAVSGSVLGLLSEIHQASGAPAQPQPLASAQVATFRVGSMSPVTIPRSPEPDGLRIVPVIGTITPQGGPVLPGLRIIPCIGSLPSQAHGVDVSGITLDWLQGNITASTTASKSIWDSTLSPSWESGLLARATVSTPLRSQDALLTYRSISSLAVSATQTVTEWRWHIRIDEDDETGATLGYSSNIEGRPRGTFRWSASASVVVVGRAGNVTRQIRYGLARHSQTREPYIAISSTDWAWFSNRRSTLRDLAVLDGANSNVHLDTLTIDV